MRVTKYLQSCLLVESESGTVLFDPGTMSEEVLIVDDLPKVDAVCITHMHGDHCSPRLIAALRGRFGGMPVCGPGDVVEMLGSQGIDARSEPPIAVSIFDSPHESVEPLAPTPQQFGYHFDGRLSHPGDSHHISETKDILALPVTAPWGSTVNAIKLALELHPRYVLPIHDWHWSDIARERMYDNLLTIFQSSGITFVPLKTGVPVTIGS